MQRTFLLKLSSNQTSGISTLSIKHCTGGYSQYNQARKIKSIQTGKEELPLFSDIIIYVETYNEIYKRPIRINKSFRRIREYKINIWESVYVYILAINNQKQNLKYHLE